MRLLRVVNTRHNRRLGDRVGLADGWFARLRGLVARPAPLPGEGLLLTPCRSVHMYGMGYSLDVAFLNAAGVVVATYHALSPGSHTRWHRHAVHALELPAGTLQDSDTVVGDALSWAPEPLRPTVGDHRGTEILS